MYINSGIKVSFKASSPLIYVGVVVSIFGLGTLLHWPTVIPQITVLLLTGQQHTS